MSTIKYQYKKYHSDWGWCIIKFFLFIYETESFKLWLSWLSSAIVKFGNGLANPQITVACGVRNWFVTQWWSYLCIIFVYIFNLFEPGEKEQISYVTIMESNSLLQPHYIKTEWWSWCGKSTLSFVMKFIYMYSYSILCILQGVKFLAYLMTLDEEFTAMIHSTIKNHLLTVPR